MNPGNFFAELKRRNVLRMAGLYLVGAWLVVQVAGTVLPMFGAPEWLPRTIVVLLAIGFVPAVIFSWVFELTPEGLKRDEDVAPEQSIAPQTGRRMDRMIIVVLVLALGYFAFDKFVLTPRREAALMTSAPPNESRSIINAKSIAVLPFENRSEDEANAYFADGIQDEILTRLSKIGDLKVISRTSTQRFKNSLESIPDIAKQLGVATILEGSVRKAADQVRVHVQLIDAENDSHLWAERYDRQLIDIFAVESDIAAKIADALHAKLTGAERRAISSQPTKNTEAYQLYLKARHQWRNFFAPGYEQVRKYFQRAIELDPSFAPAYAGLGSYHAFGAANAILAPAHWPAAETALQKTLELDDTLPDAYHLLAGVVSAWNDLTAYLRLGDKEQAFVWLAKTVEEPNWFALQLKVNPVLDPLRSDPRFESLVSQVFSKNQ